MHNDPKEQKTDSGSFHITFPAPPGMDLKAGQEIVFNGKHVTVRQNADGEFEISDPEFIEQLFKMGFAPGRNNTPEQIDEILKNIPAEHRQDFLDGLNGKPRP